MSKKDLRTFYDERRGKWRLLYGNETFYNESRELIEFDTQQEVLDWAVDCSGIAGLRITTQPEDSELTRQQSEDPARCTHGTGV